jgi:hypothetical protein
MRATKASGIQWGSRLGVVAQPPLLRSSWRSWSTSPLLIKKARNPQPPLSKRWLPQERRRALHRQPLLQKRQRLPRRKRKHPPRVDW